MDDDEDDEDDEYEQNTQTKKRSCYERLTRENQEKPFAVARIMDPSVSPCNMHLHRKKV